MTWVIAPASPGCRSRRRAASSSAASTYVLLLQRRPGSSRTGAGRPRPAPATAPSSAGRRSAFSGAFGRRAGLRCLATVHVLDHRAGDPAQHLAPVAAVQRRRSAHRMSSAAISPPPFSSIPHSRHDRGLRPRASRRRVGPCPVSRVLAFRRSQSSVPSPLRRARRPGSRLRDPGCRSPRWRSRTSRAVLAPRRQRVRPCTASSSPRSSFEQQPAGQRADLVEALVDARQRRSSERASSMLSKPTTASRPGFPARLSVSSPMSADRVAVGRRPSARSARTALAARPSPPGCLRRCLVVHRGVQQRALVRAGRARPEPPW